MRIFLERRVNSLWSLNRTRIFKIIIISYPSHNFVFLFLFFFLFYFAIFKKLRGGKQKLYYLWLSILSETLKRMLILRYMCKFTKQIWNKTIKEIMSIWIVTTECCLIHVTCRGTVFFPFTKTWLSNSILPQKIASTCM